MSPSAKDGAHVLVVDDEPAISRALKANLSGHGFRVTTAGTGEEALREVERHHPDVVLLDLMLPDMDGLQIIQYIRERGSTPVIVLSVKGEERDKVAALDLGADDYLTKPFGVEELLARVRVALRHSAKPPAGTRAVFKAGSLEVDLEKRRVLVRGAEVHLTPTEYDLLKTFVRNADRVLTDNALLREVWGPDYGSEAHYLHVYVARLRKKIEEDPQQPRHLITEPGVGYRLLSEDFSR
jgi:two-component system KDP operon response regulator KdpE